MDRDTAIALLDRLHQAQNEFYAGGSGVALEQLLAPGITWTVPGGSPIAGTYRGLPEVSGYFRRRRDLAASTFRMTRRGGRFVFSRHSMSQRMFRPSLFRKARRPSWRSASCVPR